MVAGPASEGVEAFRFLGDNGKHGVRPSPLKKATRAEVLRSALVYVSKPGQPFRERFSRCYDVLYLSETFCYFLSLSRRTADLILSCCRFDGREVRLT